MEVAGVHNWDDEWRAFRGAHPDWPAGTDEPVYRLPEEAIVSLAGTNGRRPALFRRDQAASERAYTALCGRFHAIGVWQGRPVCYDPLNEPPKLPDPAEMKELAWDEAAQQAVVGLDNYVREIRERLTGYVGWLSVEPTFLEQASRLAMRWRALPENKRPADLARRFKPYDGIPAGLGSVVRIERVGLPAGTGSPSPAASEADAPGIDRDELLFGPMVTSLPGFEASAFGTDQDGSPPGPGSPSHLESDADAFHTDLEAFLDRWGLMKMATWDLPVPQGPLLPNPLPPGSSAQPAHGISLFLPLHYPLQSSEDLIRQVREFQAQAARRLGLDDSLAGLPHHEAYAGIFKVVHLERSIRSRFPGKPPWGLVGWIDNAAIKAFRREVDWVQKARKTATACRNGKRAEVAWLRRASSQRKVAPRKKAGGRRHE
jgi:hypothetical protein